MTTTHSESLMNIAVNSDLRIHERIKIIKGEDKKISSVTEAKAILAIPSSDIIITDNSEALSIAKMDAINFLNEQKTKQTGHNRNGKKDSLLDILNNMYSEYKILKKTVNDINKFLNDFKQPFWCY